MPELLGQLEQALGATYRLVRELGGGGMSRVFLAEEIALGHRVVIKMLPEELARGLSAGRVAEAKRRLVAHPAETS